MNSDGWIDVTLSVSGKKYPVKYRHDMSSLDEPEFEILYMGKTYRASYFDIAAAKAREAIREALK